MRNILFVYSLHNKCLNRKQKNINDEIKRMSNKKQMLPIPYPVYNIFGQME